MNAPNAVMAKGAPTSAITKAYSEENTIQKGI
jgi:hypothetical protein